MLFMYHFNKQMTVTLDKQTWLSGYLSPDYLLQISIP